MPDTLNSILEELYLKKLNVFDIPTSEEAISLAHQKIEMLMLSEEELIDIIRKIGWRWSHLLPKEKDVNLKEFLAQAIHNSMLKKLKEGEE